MKNKIKIMDYEPIKQNRWLLSFPDEFNIPEFCIKKTSALKYSNVHWEDFTIYLHDVITFGLSNKLNTTLKKLPFEITIKKLDPIGICVETIKIYSNNIDINYGKFDYGSNKPNIIKVKLKPIRVEFI